MPNRKMKSHVPCLLFLLMFPALRAAAAPAITLTNHKTGEEIRYGCINRLQD